MKKGFTLIELLVALAIIGILIGISITVYVGVTENASRSAVKQNFNAVVKWIKADAALCKMNGSSSTVFRVTGIVAALLAVENANKIAFFILE